MLVPAVFWHRCLAHRVAMNYSDTIRQAVICAPHPALPLLPHASAAALPADDFVAPPTEEQRLWHGPGTEEAEAERPGTGDGLAGPGLWELWAPGLAPGAKL